MISDVTATDGWLLQEFGRRHVRQIADPVIEPLWSGLRVLALVTGTDVELREGNGEVQDRPAIAAALRTALRADEAVLDGYLTIEGAPAGVGVMPTVGPRGPTAAELARRMWLGGIRQRNEPIDPEEAGDEVREADEGVILVAVDLLLIDDQTLLDVPLLERKRLLDSVVIAGDLIRVGIHVRAPVDHWLGTWRGAGFRQLAYKEANGRYRPGEVNDGWATADIPHR